MPKPERLPKGYDYVSRIFPENVYLAGPMTGIPQFNIPAFDDAAEQLRMRGYAVFSPAELDDPDTRAAALASPDGAPGSGAANNETWGDFLARDVKLISDGGIEKVFVLPGWHRSRGARLETFVAALCGIPVYDFLRNDVIPYWELVWAWSGPDLWDDVIQHFQDRLR